MLFFITMIHIDDKVILYYNDTYRRQMLFFITMIRIDNVNLYYNDTYAQCYSLLQ